MPRHTKIQSLVLHTGAPYALSLHHIRSQRRNNMCSIVSVFAGAIIQPNSTTAVPPMKKAWQRQHVGTQHCWSYLFATSTAPSPFNPSYCLPFCPSFAGITQGERQSCEISHVEGRIILILPDARNPKTRQIAALCSILARGRAKLVYWPLVPDTRFIHAA